MMDRLIYRAPQPFDVQRLFTIYSDPKTNLFNPLRIIRRLGLQGAQLVFSGREFAAGQVLLQLCDGRSASVNGSSMADGVLWQAPSSKENAARSK